jgi:site-specific DNA-methyltransferase (adenine-specific)
MSVQPTAAQHRNDQALANSGRFLNRIICGEAYETVCQLPPQLVDTVVTSPPYYQQRDYGSANQIGQELQVDGYIQSLARLFLELRRVVKTDGSAWVVLGDKYQNGELLGIPWQVCLAIKQTGWILRSDCIWHKPNAMPSSVKNRPTTDHEYIFFFTNSKEYRYDADAIREPHVTFSENSKMKGGRNHFGRAKSTPEAGKFGGSSNLHDGRWDQAFHPLGRNKRTVWSIPLSKFREAHFAVYPEALVETCLKATCPPGGTVLDPFSGAGTTAATAVSLGYNYIGVDCVEQYCAMARERIQKKQACLKR